jgi:hypothetical protein
VKIRNKDRLLGRSLARVIKLDSPLLFVVSSQFSLMGKRSRTFYGRFAKIYEQALAKYVCKPRPENDGKLFFSLIGSSLISLNSV